MKAFKSIFAGFVVAVAVMVVPAAAWAKTEIQFWHALQAVLGERTQDPCAEAPVHHEHRA